MKPTLNPIVQFGLLVVVVGLLLLATKPYWSPPAPVTAPGARTSLDKKEPVAEAGKTNAIPAVAKPDSSGTNAAGTNAAPTAPKPESTGTNAPSLAVKPEAASNATNAPASPGLAGTSTNAPPAGKEGAKPASSDGIQLSFQGANIEMVVEWLAKTTEKSVVKHPRVQCQLTIVSSKKLAVRDAVNLVYRALAVEGFTAIETSKSIFLVPEGQEPKMSPELMDGSRTDIPEGRQRLVKLFPLKHAQPGDIKDKLRGILTDKATIDVDERANQIIVTDYNDNLRLVVDLVKELDVPSVSDIGIEIIPLSYLEAEETASLVGMVLNAQSANPSPAGRSSSPMSSGPRPMGDSPSPPPSPSGGSSQTPGQTYKIWPDKTANRLIVAAPKSKLPEVKKLIAMLDTEKPQDMAVRVVPLKHVSAEDLVREISPLYQKMYQRTGAKGSKEIVEVTANSRSNSLIVLSSEENYKAIMKLIGTLDTEEAQEKVMQAFELKNADAEDVAKQLQELNQDQGSGYSRYVYYFNSPSERGGGKKLSVVADRRRNTVIVQAPPASMDKVAKMIAALDQPVTDNSLAPKIFPLKFVSASDLEDVLNELFLKKQQQRSYWYYDDYPSETTDRNVGRLYGKVRITSEPNSNSLIVTANSAEHLAAVEQVIKKLDAPSEAGETTLRVNLQFARANTVANSINILYAKGGSPPLRPNPQQGQQGEQRNQPQQNSTTPQTNFELEEEAKEDIYYPWLGGQPENTYRSSDNRTAARPVSDLVGRVRVVPDKRGNSLMVTCNAHFFPQIMKLVNDLDAPTPQVLISARILEIGSDFRDKLGVRWSPDGKTAFTGDDLDNAVMVNNTASYNKVFAGNTLANSLTTGILNNNVKLDVLIQFLRKNTDATVLAEPQINIADNELGRLFVGAQVPFINNSQVYSVGTKNDSYNYKNVGIILEVTPRINNAEEVALKIRAESSNIRPGELLYGGAIIDTRNFRTDLMVKNGQTAVLGGIIQKEKQDIVRKVPLLGSIPGLGWAFKKKDKVNREVELIVFLSPKITRSPEDAKDLVKEIEKTAPKIKKWREDNPSDKTENAPAKRPEK